jgi:hypothetical protein
MKKIGFSASRECRQRAKTRSQSAQWDWLHRLGLAGKGLDCALGRFLAALFVSGKTSMACSQHMPRSRRLHKARGHD